MTEILDNNALLEFQYELSERLKLQRFSTAQEKQTQAEVQTFLLASGYKFEREKRLSERDIPDFFIHSPHGNLVLEVKTRCPRKQIYRQLERYAAHVTVHGLILLTGTSMGLPVAIHGKPSVLASLGEGWL